MLRFNLMLAHQTADCILINLIIHLSLLTGLILGLSPVSKGK